MPWPDFTLSDMERYTRIYINEPSPAFFTQAELYRALTTAVKDVAQDARCVRRILDAATVANTREVSVNAYAVHFVEYMPADGSRSIMLSKIDPLRVGHYPLSGATPQYWYPFGASVGIEPVPAEVYALRLYVSDMPKLRHATFPIGSFASGWTEVVGHAYWTADATDLTFTGPATGNENAIEGITLDPETNYTIIFTVAGLSSAQVNVKAGTVAGPAVSTNDVHMVTLVSSAGTPKLAFNGKALANGGTFNVDNVYVLKEADFAAASDQTELYPWGQHLAILRAAAAALAKDRKQAASATLEGIAANEIDYLRTSVVENIPDGKNSLKYQ